MSKEEVEKLNDRNSLIVFCVNEYVCLVSEDRQHILILNDTGPRMKRLTRRMLKPILSRWKEQSFISTTLIFKEQDSIKDRILESVKILTMYHRFPAIRWYYTVSL